MSSRNSHFLSAKAEEDYRQKALKMFPLVCGLCAREFSG